MRPNVIFHIVLTLHLGTAVGVSTEYNQGLFEMIAGKNEHERKISFI